MSSRAALLPTPGDPFLLNYWLDCYRIFWMNEVDKLYIHLNTPIEKSAVDFIQVKAKELNATVIYSDHQIEHGEAIGELLEACTEDYVVLLEDDCFIFRSGRLDKQFRLLEAGMLLLVGSKRGSCSLEILEAAKNKWGLDYSGMGDQGCNFWPNLLFSSRSLLNQTTRNFGARAWYTGEKINGLDYVVEVPVVNGDTFVNTSLELRSMVPEHLIGYVPQYHGHPDDMEHYKNGTYLFDGNAPWIHVGSLSSGIGGVLKNQNGVSLAQQGLENPPRNPYPNTPHDDFERREWERRVQWWATFYQHYNGEPWDLHKQYGDAIVELTVRLGLSRDNIESRIQAFKTLGLL